MLVFCLLLAQSQLVSTTGYVDSRTTISDTRVDGTPALTELAEANVQLKITPDEHVTFYADASLFWQGAWLIQGGDRELQNYRPTVVLSEAYADLPLQEHFRVVVGKKRIVWGSGLAFNPTDVLNPPKDPTDPTFQRAGAWLGEVEFGFEKVALSFIAAGKATQSFAGLPTGLVTSPPFASVRDDDAHYALTGRLYLLLGDLDVNLIYGFTNLYNDAFRTKSRAGLSLSRVFGTLELHAEAMLYGGSSRAVANGNCIENPVACVARGESIISRPDLEATYVNAQALVGGRWQFDENGVLGAEYYFNGEGLEGADFTNLATLALKNPTLAQQALSGATDPGSPQKFTLNAFRRHYLAINASKSRLWDDWSISGAVIVGLEDLSAQLVPQLQWMPKEWLQFTAAVYVPFAGLESEGVTIDGTHYGQFTLSPFQTRVLIQARAFF